MSELPEKVFLGKFESKLFSLIKEYWPVTSIELAELLHENLESREEKKRAYSRYSYYLNKMINSKLILSKKSGKTLIVWPLEAEKFRVIESIILSKPLREKDAKQLF